MYCTECGNEINDNAVVCLSCGCQTSNVSDSQGLSRVVYVLLAWFFGLLGVHNFVAGYTGKGVAQLAITLVTGVLIFPLFAVGLWVIIEMITVTKSADGTPFS